MGSNDRELMNNKFRKFPEMICFKPIGIIYTPFISMSGVPRQSSLSEVEGTIEIFEHFQDGLKDLEYFSHIYCLYYFDLIKPPVPLQSRSFSSNDKKGVFSIRTPFRPNPIGLSIFELVKIKQNQIHIKGVDAVDRTPVLDIKPYVSNFDVRSHTRNGWLQGL